MWAGSSAIPAVSEWLYANAGQVAQVDEDLWLELGASELGRATRAFSSNLAQIRRFWEMPPYIMEILAINLHALTDTAITLTGRPSFSAEEGERLKSEIIRITKERADQKTKEAGSWKAATGYDFSRSVKAFGELVNRELPEMGLAMRATLSAQILLYQTAVETLCADLARSADEVCSRVLPDGQSFQSTKQIRKAFDLVFADDKIIERIIGDPSFRKLAIVRNVFAHAAGVVDQKAINYATEIGWDFPGELGQPFHLDGEKVRELSDPVIRLSVDLIRAVDKNVLRRRRAAL